MGKNKRFLKWRKRAVGGDRSVTDMGVDFLITKNKRVTLDLFYSKEILEWFNLLFQWSRKQDHAGLLLDFSFLWLKLGFKIYDRRHWNTQEDEWEKDAEKDNSDINKFKYEWF